MKDFGYDVRDYCDVDPLFGSLADFDRRVERAHALGLHVVIDWVRAHTSDQHPWFQAAFPSREAPERSFYVFRDPAPGGGPPNNWTGSFHPGASAWRFEAASGQYFLHSFPPEQPDLDWHCDELRRRMLDTLRFWLERGVDGFRFDVIHNISKNPSLPDPPADKAQLPSMLFNDHPSTHAHLRKIRKILDGYPGDRTSERSACAGRDDPAVDAPWDAPSLSGRGTRTRRRRSARRARRGSRRSGRLSRADSVDACRAAPGRGSAACARAGPGPRRDS
jgi:glycosidase